MSDKRRVLVVGDGLRAAVVDAVPRISDRVDGRVELDVRLDREADLSGHNADLVVVLGGDGSILSAMRRLGEGAPPVLGINFGKLGFLAAVHSRDLDMAIEEALVGDRVRVTERMTLAVNVRRADGTAVPPMRGLNDAVVERWGARSLSVAFFVDNRPATTFRGDGVIVATPTGSTAHSLAAGGPIVEPLHQALVVSPICAHSMSNRPIVLAPKRVVKLRVEGGSVRPGLAVDGQVLVELNDGDEVEISRSPSPFRLAVPVDRSFFEVLRTRLHWAGQPPYEGV